MLSYVPAKTWPTRLTAIPKIAQQLLMQEFVGKKLTQSMVGVGRKECGCMLTPLSKAEKLFAAKLAPKWQGPHRIMQQTASQLFHCAGGHWRGLQNS